MSVIQTASWQGQNTLATRKQLLSSIAGVYTDIQDIQLSTINVNTLTVSTGNFSLLTLSTLSFKGADFGGLGIDLSFDLGLGDAVGGLLGGLGAAVGGAFIGLGTGAGLAIQGVANGLFSLANTRGTNYIDENVFETVNGTSQLQISTLGNAHSYYSSIFRTVSSVSANEVPGPEILISTIFPAGTTCIRTASDPLNLITTNSTINTSTIQSFGQWVPFLDPTVTSEDIYARYANFSTLTLDTNYFTDGTPMTVYTSNASGAVISLFQTEFTPTSFSLPVPFSYQPPVEILALANQEPLLYSQIQYPTTLNYISTTYQQFQSTITTQPGPIYFIDSNISTPALFTWAGATLGDFAVCESDETNFRSTATFDFQAQTNDLFIQWGLAVDNRNSTIGAGTSKRVTWDNTANTSNFIDIPLALSTVATQNLTNIFQLIQSPYETRFLTNVPGPQGNGVYIQAQTMRVAGGQGVTSASNQPGYNYQFDGSMYITGTLEADTIIAISSIISISTNITTLFSTVVLQADDATISTATIGTLNGTSSYFQNGSFEIASISSLTVSTLNENSVSLSNATIENLNATAASLLSANMISAGITNLTVQNLIAQNLVYGNAEAPNIQTSTITFGYTGNFSAPPTSYPLNLNVATPTGLSYTSIASASNQVLNIMNASNTVNVTGQLFSTPFSFYLANFGASNIQGWASTINVNNFSTTVVAGFSANTPPGQVYIQGGPFSQSIVSCLIPQSPEVIVRARSTFTFTSDGVNWSYASTFTQPAAPTTYNNTASIFMDFENFTISTTDTLVLSADILKVNATTNIPSLQANVINTSNLNVNPLNAVGGINTLYNKPVTIPFNTTPTQVSPLQMSFTEQSPDGIPQYNFIPPFMGSNSFTSYNVSSWNNSLWRNTVAFSLGIPSIYMGDVQTYSPYSGSLWIDNTIQTNPSYALPIYFISTTGPVLLTSIPGGNYGQISTVNGSTWTTNTNAPNPMTRGGNFSNVVTFNQTISQTTMNNTQNLAVVAPNTTFVTGSMNLYADQIRVNSRTYGYYPTTGLPSFPIGIENGLYIDSNMFFTYLPGPGLWESVAQNVLYNINNTIFYDAQTWMVQVIPSRFRTNDNQIYSWDVQPGVIPVTGGDGYTWVIDRYILVSAPPGGPGSGANAWHWYMAIPRNYCVFLT